MASPPYKGDLTEVANDEHDSSEDIKTKRVSIYGFSSGAKTPISVDTDGNFKIALDSYKINDVDADASPNYYGFTDKAGNWYILKETISVGADTYRYAKGSSDYTTNWTNRVSLSYQHYYDVF